MTDAKDPPPDTPSKPRRGGSVLLAAGLAVMASVAVVYGIATGGGKEAGSGGCDASRAALARLAPLASGEVAALSVNKSPRAATDVSFLAPDGQRKTLRDLRGKTVLLNLWATWCIPCREEMPALDKLQAKLGGADFEVVAVNIDTARLEKRQAFLNDAGVKSLTFYADPSADVFQTLKRAGKVLGLPTSILVDAEGCELGIMAGPADWASDDAARLVTAAAEKSNS